MIRIVLLLTMVIYLPATHADAADGKEASNAAPPSLAVVNVGQGSLISDFFLDLLLVELGRTESFSLVERAEIRRLLREQALSLSLGAQADPEEMLKLGRLVKADLLLLAEPAPTDPANKEEGATALRLRLVETRYGLKPADDVRILEGIGGDLQEADFEVSAAAKWVNKQARRLETIHEQPNIVAVSSFHSEELSPRWNWLCDVLPAGVQHHLVGTPELVLAERQRTWPLVEERTLVDGLPEALRAAVMLVEGSFRVDRERGPDALAVTLRGHRGGEVLFETIVEGSTEATGALTDALANAIVKQAGLDGLGEPLDRQVEAKLLLAQGEAYLRIGDQERAVGPLEAAIALAPEQIEAKVRLIDATSLDRGTWPWGVRELEGKVRRRFLREAVPALLRNLYLAEHMLDRPESWIEDRSRLPSSAYSHEILRLIRSLFSYPPLVQRYLGDGDESRVIVEEMRPVLRALHAKYLDVTESARQPDYVLMLEQVLWSGYWWCHSPEEYLAMVRHSMEQAAEAPPGLVRSYFSFGLHYHLETPPYWRDRTDLHEVYRRFLNELATHEHVVIRAAAQLSFARFYARGVEPPRRDLARQHYRQFIGIVVDEIIPNHPELENDIPSWTSDTGNSGVQFEPLERGRLFARVAQAQLEQGLRKNSNSWESIIRPAVQALEAGEKPEEAEALLELAVAQGVPAHQGKLVGWLQQLRQRHPDRLKPVAEIIAAEEFVVEKSIRPADLADLFKKEGFPATGAVLRRLVATDSSVAVAVSAPAADGERIGLLRLEPSSLRPLSFSTLDEPIRIDPTTSNLAAIYGRWGPVAAAHADTVYLGFPGGGMARFPAGDRPSVMTEETGLPSNDIRRIEILHDKLYVTAGSGVSGRALVELDLTSEQSRVLLSDEPDELLDGRSIDSMLADANRGILWLSLRSSRGGVSGGLYRFDPRTRETDRLDRRLVPREMWWEGERIGMRGYNTAGHLDPSTGQVAWLLKRAESASPRRARWAFDVNLGPSLPVHDGFVTLGLEPGRRQQLFYFSDERDGPVVVQGESLPSGQSIGGMLPTTQGLLLLTTETLYRLPTVPTAFAE